MTRINFKNVEELIFRDRVLQKELPDFISFFNEWKLSKMLPGSQQMGKRAIVNFMNGIRDRHLDVISNYLGVSVTIDRLDYSIVKNIELEVDEVEDYLNNLDTAYANYSISRNKDKVLISFWR